MSNDTEKIKNTEIKNDRRTKMNIIKSKAQKEFEILNKTVKDAIIAPFEKEILALVNAFDNSGQSGGSAPYTANAISRAVKKLCLQEPICPLTCEDDEWMNTTKENSGELFYQNKKLSSGEPFYQNKRLSSVFKKGKNGKPYYLDAIVFKSQNGTCFTAGNIELPNGQRLSSSQFIKLPFEPKTFYIDVIETEWANENKTIKRLGGGWWTSKIKDINQLDEVFEYYDQKHPQMMTLYKFAYALKCEMENIVEDKSKED